MCKLCTHAFAISEAEEAPFTNGRLIHCPWCDRPLLARFHAALQSEYAEENLLFWHDVEAYQGKASDEGAEPEILQGMMKTIYDR